jgi:hypothetical protein
MGAAAGMGIMRGMAGTMACCGMGTAIIGAVP